MKTYVLSATLILVGLLLFGIAQPASADMNGLISLLMNDLGVSKEQATGGAGSIFKYAKQKLSAQDFSKVAEALPGIDSLIGSAPKTGATSGSVGTLSSYFGSKSSSLGAVAGLADSFSKLGMDSDMVNQFVKVVLDFTQSEGGEAVANLLKKALL